MPDLASLIDGVGVFIDVIKATTEKKKVAERGGVRHILKLDRLRLRGPNGRVTSSTSQPQNLRKLAKLIPALTPKPA